MIEPQKDRSLESLHPAMGRKTQELLDMLRRAGVPFGIGESRRTVDRQAWLYASGRTRPGPVLTQKDGGLGVWPMTHPVASERGKTRRSRHQSGLAVDLYPMKADGRGSWCPPAEHEAWSLLASAARSLGLRAGRDWGDSPHVEWQGALPATQREE